jgi:hypothetical protein
MYSLVALAVLLGGSMFSYARMGTSDARLIPYSGTLRANGAAPSGVYDMRFGLFASEPSGVGEPACLLNDPTTCAPWGEEQQVEVSAGQFSVALGEANAITDGDLSANALYLSIAVRGPQDSGFALLGSHELIPIPWASRAATATNYEVTGALTVGGSATINGQLSATQNANVAGTLGVTGGATVGTLLVSSDSASKVRLAGSSDVDIHYEGPTTWQVGTNWAGATGGANSYYWWAGAQRMALDNAGNLRVSGLVNSGCPAGMEDSGAGYCIDVNRRTESAYASSIGTCASEGKTLCSFVEVCTAIARNVTPNEAHRVSDLQYYGGNGAHYLGAQSGAANGVFTGTAAACTALNGTGPQGAALSYRCCRGK